MKKITVLTVLLMAVCMGAFAKGLPAFNIEVIYVEHTGHEADVEVTARYYFNRGITLNSQPEILLPDNWEFVSVDHTFSGEYMAEDELDVVFTVRHDYENLPFYPDQLYIEHYWEDDPSPVRALFMVYFTPYNTTEVIGEEALTHQRRVWFAKTEEEPERIEIDPNIIPESDIPENFVPEEDWETDFRTIHIPGLAYSIPMAAIHPDEIPEELLNQGGSPEEGLLGDNCFLSKRFKGHISGQIVAEFLNEENPTIFQALPLRGVDIEIVERNQEWTNIILGRARTDTNGVFSVWVSICRAFEGDNVELFLRIKGKNNYYRIYASKKGNPYWEIEKHETNHTYWEYDGGDTRNLDFGTITVFHETIKAVHLSVLAWEYVNAFSGQTLETNLIIKTGTNNSFFLPDQSCGVGIPVVGEFFIPHPAIRLSSGDVLSETTTWHEFGHFLMWQLQNKCWIDLLSGSFAKHSINRNSNNRIAWTEGWAHAFAQICDAHYRNLDGEHYLDEQRNNYERRTFGPGISNAITNGFASEFFVACTLYDLWDGADKFPPSTPSGDHNDLASGSWQGDADASSLSFAELCTIVKNGDVNSLPENNGKIEDIQVFFQHLTEDIHCDETIKNIRQCFFRNEINDQLNVNDYFFNSDVLYKVESKNYVGSPFSDPILGWLLGYDYDHHQRINVAHINAAALNFNTPYSSSTSSLNQDLLISNQGKLYINNNLPPGIQLNNTNPERPALHANSVYEVCNQSDFTVGGNGSIIIGDPSGDYTAHMVLKSGSTLVLENNSLTRINNHSKLIIESGAQLIFEPGAVIELNGTDAILEIAGELILEDGATFTRNGTGFVRFKNATDESLQIGIDAEFYLNGSGQSDKVLELQAGEIWAEFDNLSRKSFKVTNAKVVNSGVLKLRSNVHLNNVRFEGGSLMTFAQNNVYINNCYFYGSTYGINAYQDGGHGTSISVTNCTFEGCLTGFNVYDKGFTLSNCTFIENTSPIVAENLTANSSINTVSINISSLQSLSNAISLTGFTFPSVLLDEVDIANAWGNGLYANHCRVNMKCSGIEAYETPVVLETGAIMDMSKVNGGSYGNNTIQLHSNGSGKVFGISGAEMIYLQNGQNAIIKENASDKYFAGISSGGASFSPNYQDILGEKNRWYPCVSCSNTLPTASDYIFTLVGTIDFDPILTGTILDPCNQSSMMEEGPCANPEDCLGRKGHFTEELEQGTSLYVLVRPNPASDYIYVDITSEKASDIRIRIHSPSGALIKTIDLRAEEQIPQTVTIATESLNPGVYMLELYNGSEYVRKRIAIVR